MTVQCNIYGRRTGHNPWVAQHLTSPECASYMREAGTMARDLYVAVVAKDTAALAESAQVELVLGGEKMDRICADMVVGRGLPRDGYGAAHEFGIGTHPDSRPAGQRWGAQKAADDLVKVLAILDSLP